MTLYVPSHFRVEDSRVLDAFIAANAFGTLVSSGPGGLHASHIPFGVNARVRKPLAVNSMTHRRIAEYNR